MNFDGSVVHFERDVRTHARESTDEGGVAESNGRGDVLDVTLSQFVNFADKEPAEDVEMRRVVYDGNVYVERHEFDEFGVAKAIEHMYLPNLTIDQLTGEMLSRGAGKIDSVRLGSGDPLADSNRTARPRERDDDESKLTFLQIEYQRGITGNTLRREVHFSDQVIAVHGPVESWDQKLSADRPENLGPNGKIITCDELAVYEMGPVIEGKKTWGH